MDRTEVFNSSYPVKNRSPKSLRHNAHEYADWAHDLEPAQGGDHAITNRRYGRGASGESST